MSSHSSKVKVKCSRIKFTKIETKSLQMLVKYVSMLSRNSCVSHKQNWLKAFEPYWKGVKPVISIFEGNEGNNGYHDTIFVVGRQFITGEKS